MHVDNVHDRIDKWQIESHRRIIITKVWGNTPVIGQPWQEITLAEMSNCREKVPEAVPRKLTNSSIFQCEEISRSTDEGKYECVKICEKHMDSCITCW